MGWFSDFFMTRALANMFGFKGIERDVFFALNYLNHQKTPIKRKKTVINRNSEKKEKSEEENKSEYNYEPDLIVQCTHETFPQSIKCVSDYLSQKENRSKTARIEIYKKVIIE